MQVGKEHHRYMVRQYCNKQRRCRRSNTNSSDGANYCWKSNPPWFTEADCMLKQIASRKFIVTILSPYFLADCIGIIGLLSKSLQRANITY